MCVCVCVYVCVHVCVYFCVIVCVCVCVCVAKLGISCVVGKNWEGSKIWLKLLALKEGGFYYVNKRVNQQMRGPKTEGRTVACKGWLLLACKQRRMSS